MFWLSWTFYGIIMVFITSLMMILGGYACVFDFFLMTNFFVLFLTFFVYGLSMLAMAFMISTVVSTAKGANILFYLSFLFLPS